ncbi:MAG: tyrosinase family protein [Crocosphaera sp.]|nr:tyrosinase family protein [Crocosphaera sp.]
MFNLLTTNQTSVKGTGVAHNLRHLCLKSVCTLLLCFALVMGTLPPPVMAASYSAPSYTRYEAHTPEGQKNLESLKIALQKMKEMGCENPVSWYYQGAIHWVPTASEDISALQNENPLCPSYSNFPAELTGAFPGSDKLLASWDNCTHAPNQGGQNSVIHFLPWHRLYVHHFEKIVRKLANDPEFSLPYWGYISLFDTELPDKTLLTMPTEFRSPADVSNALYESARDKSLTAGEPFTETFSQENLLDPVEGLRRQKVYADFNEQIDVRPHGLIHVYLGGGINEDTDLFNPIYNRTQTDEGETQYGLMTNVPSAGFDPIFWMHHGNIDRLWAQWTNETNVIVTPEELQKVTWPYQFFEPNGEVVAYDMEEVVNAVYNMDYVYDDGSSPNAVVKSNLRTLMANQLPRTLLGSEQTETTVGTEQEFTQTVPLAPQLRNQLNSIQSIAGDRLSQPNYTLEVEVSYTGQPRGIYKVYLNLPNEAEARTTAMADINTYFVGTIAFFVVRSDRPTTKMFQFDITDELLSQLNNIEELNTDAASISIRKDGGPMDETITVKNLAIYTRN